MFKSNELGSVNILSEELERKIGEVNTHLVNSQNEAEKAQIKKNILDGEITKLEETKKLLNEEVPKLEASKVSLNVDIEKLKVEIVEKVFERDELIKENRRLKADNEEERKVLDVEREELKKKKSDIEGQESVLRTVSKGLEEKEKKLDVYADRVKKLLDSVKPE